MSSLDAMPSLWAGTSDAKVKEWISEVAPDARSPEEITEVHTVIGVESLAQGLNKHSFAPSPILALPPQAILLAAFNPDRPFLKLYEAQFPVVRELQVVLLAANQVMLEMGHGETYRPIFDQEAIPPSAKGLKITLQAVKVMNDTLACYRAVTALVNHLAYGRKKLETGDGEEPPLLPLLLLRRPEAKIESDEETMMDRAKSYSDELAWLQDIVRHWNQDSTNWRLKNGLKASREKISPPYQKFLDGCQSKAGSMQYASCLVAIVASRLSDLPEVTLLAWAKRQSKDSVKTIAAVKDYLDAQDAFTQLWADALIPVPAEGSSFETLLAYTKEHHQILLQTQKAGEEFLEASTQLEDIFDQAAQKGSFDDLSLLLSLCSYGLESPIAVRDRLIRTLGLRRGFQPTSMPKLLQHWQSEKVKRATEAVGSIRTVMELWLTDHDDDSEDQGVHLKDMYESRENDGEGDGGISEILLFEMSGVVDGIRAAARARKNGQDPTDALSQAMKNAHVGGSRGESGKKGRK